MFNKLAFASALFFGIAAATPLQSANQAEDEDYAFEATCAFTDTENQSNRGWIKFRREPDSEEVAQQFILTGFEAGEVVAVTFYQSRNEPRQTWTLQADASGVAVINQTDGAHYSFSDFDGALFMLDTIMDHLDCWAHVTQKDHRKADKMEELNDRIQDETNDDDSDFEDWEDDIYDDFIDNGGQDHGNGGH